MSYSKCFKLTRFSPRYFVPHYSSGIAAKLVIPFRLDLGDRPSGPVGSKSDSGQPSYVIRLVLADRAHHSNRGYFNLQGFDYHGFTSFVNTAIATLDWN